MKILGTKWNVLFIVIIILSIVVVSGKPYIIELIKPKLSSEKISQLLNTIESSNDREKVKKAVIILGDYEVDNDKVVSALKNLVETSNDDSIIKESIFSLVFIRNAKILSYYEDLLNKSKNPTLRKYIILGFKNIITSKARSVLYSIVENDKDFEVRRTAAYVLGQSKDKKYARKFIKSLDLVISQNLIIEAKNILKEINVLNDFLNLFTQNKVYTKYISDKISAQNDIKMIEEFLLNLKDKKSAKLKDRAFLALERTKLFDSMLTNVLEKEKDKQMIENIEKAIPVLEKIENLTNEFIKQNEEQEERMMLAAIALGEMKSKEAFSQLINVFKNTENNWLKKEIVIALGNIGDNRAEDILISDLGKGNDRGVDEDIITALGQIKGEKSKKTLLNIISSHQDKWLKVKAVESLIDMKSKSVLDDVCYYFDKENDIDVKLAMISYIKNCNDKEVKTKLNNIVFDKREENEVRLNAIKAYLDSNNINRKGKDALKNEICNELSSSVSDDEKIFILSVIAELKIIEALPNVTILLKSKNIDIKTKADEALKSLKSK